MHGYTANVNPIDYGENVPPKLVSKQDAMLGELIMANQELISEVDRLRAEVRELRSGQERSSQETYERIGKALEGYRIWRERGGDIPVGPRGRL